MQFRTIGALRQEIVCVRTTRPHTLTTDWIVYRIQRMTPAERKRLLRKQFLAEITDQKELETRFSLLERQIMNLEFPEDGPSPTLENILEVDQDQAEIVAS